MSAPLRRIAVVGDDPTAALAALALAAAGRGLWAVTQVAGGAGPAQTAALRTSPALRALLERAGVDENALVAEAGGSFSLGVRYAGWTGAGSAFFSAWGETGARLGPVAFPQLLARRRGLGPGAGAFDDYALGAQAAALGRFARRSADPRSPAWSLDHGLHLPAAGAYAWLLAAAVRLGVEPVAGVTAGVERDGEGRLEALRLADGRRLPADLVVDAEGVLSADGGWDSWADAAPFDRVLRFETPAGAAASASFSTVAAHACGWRVDTPLPDRTATAFVYAASELDDADARRAAGAPPNAEVERLSAGRRRRFMQAGVVAVGRAAVRAAPLEPLAVQLACEDVSRLLDLLPEPGGGPAALEREHDRRAALAAERARDLDLMHLKLTSLPGPAWTSAREAPASDALARKLALYEARGRLPLGEEEPGGADRFVAVLDGCGVRPRRHDPQADAIPAAELTTRLDRMRAAVREAAARLPTHAEALAALSARAATRTRALAR